MGLTGLAATVFLFLSWLIAVAWLWQAWGPLHGMPYLPALTAIEPETLPALRDTPNPHLTVIVPACNEQETIQASLRSLLGSTGIHLEILAVNDRSTDSTGELMRQVASEASASILS